MGWVRGTSPARAALGGRFPKLSYHSLQDTKVLAVRQRNIDQARCAFSLNGHPSLAPEFLPNGPFQKARAETALTRGFGLWSAPLPPA